MKQSTFHHPQQTVFDAIKRAAISLELEIRNESLTKGTLSLYSSGGLFSFGNEVDVDVKKSEMSKSILKVSARSAAAIQVFDWGTNNDLESAIINKVKNLLSK